MKKDLDKRLKWLNGENYDAQWHWSDNKEMEKDIIQYFGLNNNDELELNMFFRKVEWDGAGEYIFSGMQGRFIPLELALSEEFNGSGMALLEHYTEEQQKEILEYVNSTKEKTIMKHEIIEEVFEDYFGHQSKLQNNDYSSIYWLVEVLEENWNSCGADLEYDLDIKDDYLYLENTKICSMDQLICCEAHGDAVKYQLKDEKFLYIIIQWVAGNDAFINQIYIQGEDEDDCEILYEKDEDITQLEADDMPL